MKISEMIEQLEKLKADFGDLPVFTAPNADETYWLNPVDGLSVSPVVLQKEGHYLGARTKLIDRYTYKGDPAGPANAIEINL